MAAPPSDSGMQSGLPDLRAGLVPDLATPHPAPGSPPSAVWISAGGGSAVVGGARLNTSLPGASPVGNARAAGGSTVNLGYFANDSK
jgi:hypothetical protein